MRRCAAHLLAPPSASSTSCPDGTGACTFEPHALSTLPPAVHLVPRVVVVVLVLVAAGSSSSSSSSSTSGAAQSAQAHAASALAATAAALRASLRPTPKSVMRRTTLPTARNPRLAPSNDGAACDHLLPNFWLSTRQPTLALNTIGAPRGATPRTVGVSAPAGPAARWAVRRGRVSLHNTCRKRSRCLVALAHARLPVNPISSQICCQNGRFLPGK